MAVEDQPSEDVDSLEQTHTEMRKGENISLVNITKTFDNGTVVAVDDVSLEIESNEFVVLLGPSGCGKTTTLRCIAGLENPDSGHIYVGEEEITTRKPKDRNLSFVFQSIALFPHMSVRKNIQFGLDMNTDLPKDEKNRRVNEVAELLGIEEMLDRQPSALSGGQRQRVSLGRAMVTDPAAFLLDEPLSALDANLRDRMRVEIKKLQRELQKAMIFVTHDQEEAMTLGDKIVVMDSGEIQQVGSPHEIYNEPANLFVANFIGSPSANFVDCEVRSDGDGFELVSDLFTLGLPPKRSEGLQAEDGDSVTVGIRPEYLDVDATDPDFTAELEVIEPRGSRDAVYMTAGDQEIVALTDQNEVTSEQETVPLSIEGDRIWAFDRAGERVL